MSSSAQVDVDGDRIVIHSLELADPQLARFVEQTPGTERAALAERALRIGLLTLCTQGVSLSADVVRSEFERLSERMEATHRRAADALAATLREHFADDSGRLPRTLERFLGDSGSLRRMTALTCSTRTGGNRRWVASTSCWAGTSTATARVSRSCSIRRGPARLSTSSGAR